MVLPRSYCNISHLSGYIPPTAHQYPNDTHIVLLGYHPLHYTVSYLDNIVFDG